MPEEKKELSPEEEKLFSRAMSGVKPMKPTPAPTKAKAGKPSEKPPARRTDVSRLKAFGAAARVSGKPIPKAPSAEPTPGEMDRRNAQRLRRGQLTIEGTLDLHGDTQRDARERLDGFLARAQEDGKRCILVITGKGYLTSGDDWDLEADDFDLAVERRGVLRRALPRWLAEGENRRRVLSWHPARARHGGAGAFYVLLRRPRARG